MYFTIFYDFILNTIEAGDDENNKLQDATSNNKRGKKE
jgi:hypothetical protein